MHTLKLDESKGEIQTKERRVYVEDRAIEKRKRETVREHVRLWYLLLIFMPPRGGFAGGLLPSAKEVVLGRPLILKPLSTAPPPPPPHLHRETTRRVASPPPLFLSLSHPLLLLTASTRLGRPVPLRQISSSSSASA